MLTEAPLLQAAIRQARNESEADFARRPIKTVLTPASRLSLANVASGVSTIDAHNWLSYPSSLNDCLRPFAEAGYQSGNNDEGAIEKFQQRFKRYKAEGSLRGDGTVSTDGHDEYFPSAPVDDDGTRLSSDLERHLEGCLQNAHLDLTLAPPSHMPQGRKAPTTGWGGSWSSTV